MSNDSTLLIIIEKIVVTTQVSMCAPASPDFIGKLLHFET